MLIVTTTTMMNMMTMTMVIVMTMTMITVITMTTVTMMNMTSAPFTDFGDFEQGDENKEKEKVKSKQLKPGVSRSYL